MVADHALEEEAVELPTMFMVSWLVLGEAIGPLQWLACLLITLAIVLTPARRTINLTTQLTMPSQAQKKPVPRRLSDTWF